LTIAALLSLGEATHGMARSGTKEVASDLLFARDFLAPFLMLRRSVRFFWPGCRFRHCPFVVLTGSEGSGPAPQANLKENDDAFHGDCEGDERLGSR
jgi:hypothetical protein